LWQFTSNNIYNNVGGNIFIDSTVSGSAFIYGFNTPKNAAGSSILQVYNNSTDRNIVFQVQSKGTTSGIDNVIITNNSTLGNILNCVGLNVGNNGTPDTSRQSMINMFRNVTGSVQNAVSAELDLGSNAATLNAISTLDFKLSSFPGTINNFGRLPDNVVMSLVGNGNVGINNSSPSFNLDVAGTVRFAGTNAAPQLLLNNTNTVSYIQSQFFTPSLATGNSIQYHLGASASAFNSEVMFFNYNGSGSNTNSIGFSLYGQPQVMNITGTGVGINNTNPAYALDVSGTLRSTNNTILNSGNNDVLIVAQALSSYGSGLWTGTSQAGLQIGWNNLGGSGGTDFLNNGQGGGGPCFNFWVVNSVSQTPSRIAQINNSGTYSQISDYRVKNNVKNLDNTFTIDKLRPVEYIYSKTNEKQIGFIAHEIQEIFPQLVEGEKDCENYQTLNYSGLIPVLTLEIQRLKTTIINQQNLINDILQRLNIIESSK